ncbi:hypothetical protein BFJ63_vAg18746 [Fusarium oxysporum f. sp. narcissi]|uniref:Prion-inhibition and propagation HeLo domain-containing protein n=2 Tax=Fusarium oxysporum TaxID=5507 RepID=A0A4Q2UXJ7_FUSOX|nr:hypothetical protein BFJ65_g14567 [Fusarium oxysporum f. sp. cepae]RKK24178.1 hypothetical protein BFJ67_g16756 [Fusarium oxysporum f. sp. cepae]RKK26810.1 hypothetical protein BFJ66_g16948 [Fusarium oxysporum f. sp. cepae]RYC78380.1 hypothetical protein BFJ63_vAg18746 [Fusarium oxysporum f. sp. narcissi]
MREILQGIVTSFQTCYKRSCRQSGKLDNNLREEDASMELDKSWQQLRDQLYNITKRSLSGVNLIDKTPWTIYGQEHAEILILDCVSYIEELENDTQFGAGDLRNEATKDIEELNDTVSLRRLKKAAQDVDTLMEIVANDKYELLIQDGAIHIGRGSGWYQSSSQLRSGNNFVGSIEPGPRGRIHVGNIYGGKGIWDDWGN